MLFFSFPSRLDLSLNAFRYKIVQTRLEPRFCRKFCRRGFARKTSPCHTSQRRLQTPDGDGSHRLAPTKKASLPNVCIYFVPYQKIKALCNNMWM